LFLVWLDEPSGLAIDEELLYVTARGQGVGNGSIIAIGRTRATGILPIVDGLTEPTAIAADQTALYWIEQAPHRAVMRFTKE
jgi:hypothetical protein